jgi:hypothetical protein
MSSQPVAAHIASIIVRSHKLNADNAKERVGLNNDCGGIESN